MSDPAIEATQRAWVSNAGRPPYPTERELMTYAAREMANPIRELHKPRDNYGTGLLYCSSCVMTRWPCRTARLIYPTAEIEKP